jgi:hypothetical protein
MWLGIWNNYSMTGLALVGGGEVFCDELDSHDAHTFCNKPKLLLSLFLPLFGIALSTFAGSLLANGQIAAPDCPVFSQVEGVWQTWHLKSRASFFLRGATLSLYTPGSDSVPVFGWNIGRRESVFSVASSERVWTANRK